MDEREMSTLAFTITGEPKGQPRPRAFARKMGSIHVARFYDSDVADAWKRAVQIALLEMVKQTRWELTLGPVSVSLNFAMPRPKSHSGMKGLKSSAPVHHVGKPDVDNLAKLMLDQITRSGNVWRDDSQVVSLTVHKFWAVANEQGCSVSISTLGI
jgi:Holliday junction resolvase RusA-like endonuclease